jgi:hypothetical protein
VRKARHLDPTVILSYRARNEFNPKPTSLFNKERRESRARIRRLSLFPPSFCLKKQGVEVFYNLPPNPTGYEGRVRPTQRVYSKMCMYRGRYSRPEYVYEFNLIQFLLTATYLLFPG